jgi:hypothetical protein
MSFDLGEFLARAARRWRQLGQPRNELLERYRAALSGVARPTPDQMRAFAQYVSNAHSWYKHLPMLPPGVPFNFYLDPGAGMQRTLTQHGAVEVSVRTNRGFHYSWLPTAEHRAKFGYLAFAQSRGTTVALQQASGDTLVPSDDRASFYDPARAAILPIPDAVLAAGTAFVSGIVHAYAQTTMWRIEFDGSRREAWPEESGGIEQLEKIERRIRELASNPALRKEPSLAERAEIGVSSDMELHALLRPERERQQRLMIEACRRVVDLVYPP